MRYDVREWSARPRNMACHNLVRNNKMPAGTTQPLGLKLSFCIKSASTSKPTEKTFERLTEDVWRLYTLWDAEKDDNNYVLILYIKLKYKFRPASIMLEKSLVDFKQTVSMTQQWLQNHRERPNRNINHEQESITYILSYTKQNTMESSPSTNQKELLLVYLSTPSLGATIREKVRITA